MPASEREPRARAALERVGLVSISHQPARVLSGGEQQRLALARAWMLEPEVLFLDEPTANLDPGATREIERIVGAIHAAGTKIVMVTHNLGQAQRLADEILFIHDGRLAERTAAADFFRKPATACFVGRSDPVHASAQAAKEAHGSGDGTRPLVGDIAHDARGQKPRRSFSHQQPAQQIGGHHGSRTGVERPAQRPHGRPFCRNFRRRPSGHASRASS